jgi:hypothetical protein
MSTTLGVLSDREQPLATNPADSASPAAPKHFRKCPGERWSLIERPSSLLPHSELCIDAAVNLTAPTVRQFTDPYLAQALIQPARAIVERRDAQ